jgi:hypothetical protein
VQGATTGLNVDLNNRQLHPSERTLARQLATKSDGKYTVEQIEEAIRLSGIKGSSVSPDSIAVMNNPTSTDPSEPGARFDNGMPILPNTGMVLVEQRSPSSPDVIAFVQQATGGANSPYYWSAQTASPSQATISNTPPDNGGPRYFNCATTDCLLNSANRNPNNLQNQAEDTRGKNALLATAAILGAPAVVAYGGPVLFSMGATAQTVPLVGGLSEVTVGTWIKSAAVGSTFGSGLNLVTDPNASPASLTISGVAGAAGGIVKLGTNAAAGLANQWVPTTIPNWTTQILGTSTGKNISIPATEVIAPTSGTSWWTSPVMTCGPFPRNPC